MPTDEEVHKDKRNARILGTVELLAGLVILFISTDCFGFLGNGPYRVRMIPAGFGALVMGHGLWSVVFGEHITMLFKEKD